VLFAAAVTQQPHQPVGLMGSRKGHLLCWLDRRQLLRCCLRSLPKSPAPGLELALGQGLCRAGLRVAEPSGLRAAGFRIFIRAVRNQRGSAFPGGEPPANPSEAHPFRMERVVIWQRPRFLAHEFARPFSSISKAELLTCCEIAGAGVGGRALATRWRCRRQCAANVGLPARRAWLTVSKGESSIRRNGIAPAVVEAARRALGKGEQAKAVRWSVGAGRQKSRGAGQAGRSWVPARPRGSTRDHMAVSGRGAAVKGGC